MNTINSTRTGKPIEQTALGPRFWLDHTSLHVVGRCFDGRAKGDMDLRGLLQFAAQIMFGDALLIADFDLPQFSARSKEIVEQLRVCRIDDQLLKLLPQKRESYADACQKAAEDFANDVTHLFPVSDSDLDALYPDLPGRAKEVQDDLHTLLTNGPSSRNLARIARTSLDQRAAGAVHYMIADSDLLWSKVCKVIREDASWSPLKTEKLAASCRYYLNQQLAADNNASYFPAVARAQLLRRETGIVLKRVEQIVLQAAQQLSPTPLNVISLAGTLVTKAKGDPRALILEAAELRLKTTKIRSWISPLIELNKKGGPAGRAKVENQIKMLSETLYADLGITKRPRLLDSFELAVALSIPPISIGLNAVTGHFKTSHSRADQNQPLFLCD